MKFYNRLFFSLCLIAGANVAFADCPPIQAAIDDVAALKLTNLTAEKSITGGFLEMATLKNVAINYYSQKEPANPLMQMKELSPAFHTGISQVNADGSTSCVYLGTMSNANTPNLTAGWDQVIQIQNTDSGSTPQSAPSSTGTAWTPTRLIIFGDSLSDMGYQDKLPNLPEVTCPDGSQQFKEPTWTSPCGYPWPHYLAAKLGVPVPHTNNANPPFLPNYPTHNSNVSGSFNLTADTPNNTDYAAGGAVSGNIPFINSDVYYPPNISYQIAQYAQQVAADPSLISADDLYIVWIGSNDFFRDMTNLSMTTVNNINNNTVAAIQAIKAINPKAHIIVADVTDLGDTPLGTVDQHVLLNEMAYQQGRDLASYINAHYDASVRVLDTYAPIQVIYTMTVPALVDGFSFTNNTVPACKDSLVDRTVLAAINCDPIAQGVKDPEQYVFEDPVHPTDQTHRMIADMFYQRITDSTAAPWPTN